MVSKCDHHASGIKAWRTRRETGKDRHSKATIEHLRQTTIRYITNNTKGRHISQLENEVAQELLCIGINFIRQYPIRSPKTGRFIAVADFFLNDHFVLEVNGTFWHSDPRFYPTGPSFPAQYRTATGYIRKVMALKELGIPLIEIWEADLEQSVINTLRSALSGIIL
jgi:G:T-mismatch repair DNA endonuclease (very short patch repair protein)